MEQAEYKEFLDNCRFCTMCKHVCPVGLATQREGATPRGVALSLYAMSNGLADMSQEIHRHLVANCTLCGTCYESCVTQQDLPGLVLAAREKLVSEGEACTEAVNIRDNLIAYGNPFDSGSQAKRMTTDQQKDQAEVLLFPGCTALFFQHGIVQGIEGILDTAQIQYAVLKDGDCCGAPLKELGFADEFEKHSETLEAKIQNSGAKTVVTTCSSCAYWLEVQFSGKTEMNGVRFINSVDYLLELVKSGIVTLQSRSTKSVRLQSPCRTARSVGRSDPALELLKLVEGMKLDQYNTENLVVSGLKVPESLCCGGCGGTRFVDGATSDKVASYQLLQMAKNTILMETVVTSCSTCRDQLGKAATSTDVDVFHVAELVSAVPKR